MQYSQPAAFLNRQGYWGGIGYSFGDTRTAGASIFRIQLAPFPHTSDIVGASIIIRISATPASLRLYAARALAVYIGTALLMVGGLRMRQKPLMTVRTLAFSSLHHNPLSGEDEK
jgi:hypothetical protein